MNYIRFGSDMLKSICSIKFFGKRIPIYCEWEVTKRCNMKCFFCSTLLQYDRNKMPELSPKEALVIIDQLATLGTKMLHFSGGEPTLREDLPQLVEAAKSKNMFVFITTNGSTPLEKMEKLLNANLIHVSIDGTEDFHDSMRQAPGAFNKALETLRFLNSKNCKTQITTIYTPTTSYEMLEDLCDIAKKLGVKISIGILSKSIYTPMNETGKNMFDSNTSFLSEYANTIKSLRVKYKNLITNVQPFFSIIQHGGLDSYGCRAMDIAISLKQDGSISFPCNGLPLQLSKGDIRSIYYDKKNVMKFGILQGKHQFCKNCTIRCMGFVSALLKYKGVLSILKDYVALF